MFLRHTLITRLWGTQLPVGRVVRRSEHAAGQHMLGRAPPATHHARRDRCVDAYSIYTVVLHMSSHILHGEARAAQSVAQPRRHRWWHQSRRSFSISFFHGDRAASVTSSSGTGTAALQRHLYSHQVVNARGTRARCLSMSVTGHKCLCTKSSSSSVILDLHRRYKRNRKRSSPMANHQKKTRGACTLTPRRSSLFLGWREYQMQMEFINICVFFVSSEILSSLGMLAPGASGLRGSLVGTSVKEWIVDVLCVWVHSQVNVAHICCFVC